MTSNMRGQAGQGSTNDAPGALPFPGPMTPAMRLREARERIGWSQADLATAADVSASTVYRAEAGKSVGDDTMRALWDAISRASRGQIPAASGLPAAAAPSPIGRTMGQMIGSMSLPAGSADVFVALLDYSVAHGDPPEVAAALVRARREAPPGADLQWWLGVYLDARLHARP